MVTKYVLILCYDHRIGNPLIEINTKIEFLSSAVLLPNLPTRFGRARRSSTLLLIGRHVSRPRGFERIFQYLHLKYRPAPVTLKKKFLQNALLGRVLRSLVKVLQYGRGAL